MDRASIELKNKTFAGLGSNLEVLLSLLRHERVCNCTYGEFCLFTHVGNPLYEINTYLHIITDAQADDNTKTLISRVKAC